MSGPIKLTNIQGISRDSGTKHLRYRTYNAFHRAFARVADDGTLVHWYHDDYHYVLVVRKRAEGVRL